MLACFFTKLSLGLGHLRILKFRHLKSHWEKYACYGIIAFSCTINLVSFFTVLFSCVPYGFTPLNSAAAIAMGNCTIATYSNLIITYLQSTANVVVDWILVLLPIPSVLGAIMDRRTRLSIISILMLGTR
jgi:hypothetical protein